MNGSGEGGNGMYYQCVTRDTKRGEDQTKVEMKQRKRKTESKQVKYRVITQPCIIYYRRLEYRWVEKISKYRGEAKTEKDHS